jgi:hypothetical protein
VLTINNYESIELNATFTEQSLKKYLFVCKLTNQKLVCVSPPIVAIDIPVFSSQYMQLQNNQSIATSYILYGKFQFH